MIYGYIRVSSDKQTVENQRFEIEEFCRVNNLIINGWIEETISGAKEYNKRRLGLLLRKTRAGDTIVCSELSRLGRSLFMIMEILSLCMRKECRVWTIKEGYRLGDDIQSKVLAFAFGLRNFYPELADRAAKYQKYTMFVWTFSVFIILSKASFDIREMGFADLWNSGKLPLMAAVSLVLCLLQFWLGWVCERGRRPIEGSQSMGQKNTTLVIWVSSLYAGPVVALAPTCYVVWQNLVLSYMTAKIKPKKDS